MPLYDYRCRACGEFRAFRPMDQAAAPAACPACGGAAARVLAAPFLGGGGTGGWLTNPGGAGAAGSSWRRACGFGCTHANCGR
jgi:putative FmdB family regulatory protein